MNYLETIVSNEQEYVRKVMALLTDSNYRKVVTERTQDGFLFRLKQNKQVAAEWFTFLARLLY